MSTMQASASDFVIWGPAVTSGSALDAVHALYFLPNRFKLVLPPARPGEKGLYKQIRSLIRHDGLTRRVSFSQKQITAQWQAVIVDKPTAAQPGYIFGQSPEALASAILNASRIVA